jgi:hypothetical protein
MMYISCGSKKGAENILSQHQEFLPSACALWLMKAWLHKRLCLMLLTKTDH